MKYKIEADTTDNSKVYKKAIKRVRDHTGDISCSICPYHRHENGHKYQRSWKKSRKTKYKTS